MEQKSQKRIWLIAITCLSYCLGPARLLASGRQEQKGLDDILNDSGLIDDFFNTCEPSIPFYPPPLQKYSYICQLCSLHWRSLQDWSIHIFHVHTYWTCQNDVCVYFCPFCQFEDNSTDAFLRHLCKKHSPQLPVDRSPQQTFLDDALSEVIVSDETSDETWTTVACFSCPLCLHTSNNTEAIIDHICTSHPYHYYNLDKNTIYCKCPLSPCMYECDDEYKLKIHLSQKHLRKIDR